MTDATTEAGEGLLLTEILGAASEPDLHEALHRLEHHDAVDSVTLDPADLARRRMRVTSARGRDCAIALPRSSKLFNGAVLVLEQDWALVVRVSEERWLRLQPRDAAAALELGYHAGNLHWRVRFDSGDLLVALEGPEETYLARLEQQLADGICRVVDGDD
ncbi:MAG: urease accessory protein UreE [Kiloniellales bacterium]